MKGIRELGKIIMLGLLGNRKQDTRFLGITRGEEKKKWVDGLGLGGRGGR